jgi:hypothetical protein
MYGIKSFELGWAVIHSDTEEVVLLEDCPQVMMTFDDAREVAETLNKLDEIQKGKTVH